MPASISSPHSSASVSAALPPRKRARTEAEKEQRRIERIIRNRKAAHASREKKRKHVEQLEAYVKILEAKISALSNSPDAVCSLRPKGLVLSDEEEAQEEEAEEDQQELKGEQQQQQQQQQEPEKVTVSEETCRRSSLSSPPSLASPDSIASALSDISQPTTPLHEDINSLDNQLYIDINDLSLKKDDLIVATDAVYEPNPYLDSLPSANVFSNEFDIFQNESMDLNSFDALNATLDKQHTNIGYLNSFNSVHSAVMHSFSSNSKIEI